MEKLTASSNKAFSRLLIWFIILLVISLFFAFKVSADVMDDNFIAWYTYDTDHTDSGPNSADASSGGSGNFITPSGTCKVGNCLSLTDVDVNSYEDLSVLAPYLTGNSSGSILFWMYQNESIAQQCLLSFGDDSNNFFNANTRALTLDSIRGYGKDAGSAKTSDSDANEITPIQSWHHVAITHAGNQVQIWIDGTLEENSSNYWGDDFTISDVELGRYFYSTGDPHFLGLIDELVIYDDQLHPLNISWHYNGGSGRTYSDYYGAPPPAPSGDPINFISQDPADLTSTNIFATFLNITYNYTNLTGIANVALNYTINDSSARCFENINDTCVSFYGDYFTKTNNSINGINHSFYLYDNDLYPAKYNINETLMEATTHENITFDALNEAILVEFLNISNQLPYSEFEIMISKEIAGSTDAEAYYCNSSYTTGNYKVNSNCVLFATFDESSYDHCHNNSLSCHIVKSFPINITSHEILGVRVSPTSQFIFKSTSIDGWLIHYINDTIRANNSRSTNNNGNTWAQLVGTIDAHLHQFNTSDYLTYQACGTVSGVYNCTSFTSDTFDLDPLDPTAVTINTPTEGQNVTFFLNITYNNSIVSNGTPTYNISLLNADFSFNRTIKANNSNNLNYYWTTWNESGLNIGSYRIEVQAKDTVNDLQTSTVSELFNITRNGIINITANDTLAVTGLSSFSGWVYDLNTSTNETYTTSTGYAQVGHIRGHSYLISVTQPGNFTTTQQYINISQNTTLYNITFYLYAFNSVRINIFSEENMSLITGQTITISTISNLTSFTNTTTTGFIVIDFLTPNAYELRFNTSGFNPISKFITVLNDSTQNLSVYMTVNESELQVIEVVDTSNSPVEGAVVWLQKEIIGGSDQFITIQEAKTNNLGKTTVWVERDVTVFYRFAVIYENIARPIQPNDNTFTEKTYFIPGVTETIQLIIDIEDDPTDFISDRYGVTGDVYLFNSTTVKYDFLDTRSIIEGGKMEVWGKYLNTTNKYQLLRTFTEYGNVGSINYTFAVRNNTIYKIKGFIIYNGSTELYDEIIKKYEGDATVDKNTGLLLGVLIFVVVALLTAKWGPLAGGLTTVGSLFLANIFNFMNLPTTFKTGFLCLIVIVFVRSRKND